MSDDKGEQFKRLLQDWRGAVEAADTRTLLALHQLLAHLDRESPVPVRRPLRLVNASVLWELFSRGYQDLD